MPQHVRSDVDTCTSLFFRPGHRLEKVFKRFKTKRIPMIFAIWSVLAEEYPVFQPNGFDWSRFLSVSIEPENGLLSGSNEVFPSFSCRMVSALMVPAG